MVPAKRVPYVALLLRTLYASFDASFVLETKLIIVHRKTSRYSTTVSSFVSSIHSKLIIRLRPDYDKSLYMEEL